MKYVTAQVQRIRDIFVPHVELRRYPEKDAEEDMEDWNEEVHSLIEWVGMACLGAQRYAWLSKSVSVFINEPRRLKINDRVDPYVALYEPPSSQPGNLTHIQWQGFISPAFVQIVIDTTM